MFFRVISFTVFVAFIYMLLVIASPQLFLTFHLQPHPLLQWVGKFALKLLVAKEAWKRLSDKLVKITTIKKKLKFLCTKSTFLTNTPAFFFFTGGNIFLGSICWAAVDRLLFASCMYCERLPVNCTKWKYFWLRLVSWTIGWKTGWGQSAGAIFYFSQTCYFPTFTLTCQSLKSFFHFHFHREEEQMEEAGQQARHQGRKNWLGFRAMQLFPVDNI